MNLSTIYGKASLFILISSALHLIVFLLDGFSNWLILALAILYVIFAIGVARPMRLLAKLVFLVMAFGVGISIMMNPDRGFIQLIYWGITFANLAAAICLFIYLWYAPKRFK